MREHPIPQDITSYRFHIVGSMTLKQFAEIAIGVAGGFLIYSTNLPAFLKWPLMFLVFAAGTLAAFVPIAERPLDHWILTFFKALYKPTQFFWKKDARVPEVFNYESHLNPNDQGPELDLTPAKRQRIHEYLVSLKSPLSVQADPYSLQESQRVLEVLHAFDTVPTITPPTVQKHTEKPSLSIRVRNLGGTTTPEMRKRVASPESEIPVISPETYQPISNVPALKTDEVAQGIAIPEIQAVQIETQSVSDADEALLEHNLHAEQHVFLQTAAERAAIEAEEKAKTNRELPFPSKPTEPNKLVGMVLTQHDDLITDVIIEIQTPQGQIVRAVKTNALGQFFVSTPLKNGEYLLVAERDGFQFSPLTIHLNGKVVEPIEIRGQEEASPELEQVSDSSPSTSSQSPGMQGGYVYQG